MSAAFVVDAVRTPRGKGKPGGALSRIKPTRLLADLMTELLDRHERPPVEDVVVGCATQTGEQGTCVARMAAILVGLDDVPGVTVNRFCASGLDAIATAAARVMTPMGSWVLAGGVEMMSRVPMFADEGPWFADEEIADATGFVHMAIAADLLASVAGLDKGELDALAAESQRRAARATEAGHFRSLVPVRDSERIVLDRDELIRPDLDLATLTARPPAFAELVTDEARGRIARRYPDVVLRAAHQARSAPALADGAAACLIASEDAVERRGLKPRARVVSWAHVAVEPTLMVHGNVPAAREALRRARLDVQDIDLFEVNESFAAVPLHFARELEVDHARLNVDGGAIAMGHPLGATGGMLVATALDALERRDERRALVSVCGAAGVATAIVLERGSI